MWYYYSAIKQNCNCMHSWSLINFVRNCNFCKKVADYTGVESTGNTPISNSLSPFLSGVGFTPARVETFEISLYDIHIYLKCYERTFKLHCISTWYSILSFIDRISSCIHSWKRGWSFFRAGAQIADCLFKTWNFFYFLLVANNNSQLSLRWELQEYYGNLLNVFVSKKFYSYYITL